MPAFVGVVTLPQDCGLLGARWEVSIDTVHRRIQLTAIEPTRISGVHVAVTYGMPAGIP